MPRATTASSGKSKEWPSRVRPNRTPAGGRFPRPTSSSGKGSITSTTRDSWKCRASGATTAQSPPRWPIRRTGLGSRATRSSSPTGPGEWDQYSIHDPYPLVYKGKIYLYYKSDFNNAQPHVRAMDWPRPTIRSGPFTKHPLNPIMNSGHETTLFPFMEGIAAFAIHNGLEHNTIQYAPDGVSFKIAAVSSLMPVAAGPYVPDAFTDTKDGRGITWGLCHITAVGEPDQRHSILARFDCDLSRDVHDPVDEADRSLSQTRGVFLAGSGQTTTRTTGESCTPTGNAMRTSTTEPIMFIEHMLRPKS